VLGGTRRGGSRDAIEWLRMRLCGAGVSPWMQTNPSTYKVLPQLAHRVVLGGGVPLVGPQQDLRGPCHRDILPGGLLRAQGGKRIKDFRGW